MKNIYIAAADNLSRTKAYEFAEEFGHKIVGESGYMVDASNEICSSDANTIICSQKLFDGQPKQLYTTLPGHIRDKCDFFIISPNKNGTYKLKTLNTHGLHTKSGVIDDALSYVNMSKTLAAYPLFRDALDIILSSPDVLTNITRAVYGRVAKLHNTDSRNVELNMRTAKTSSLLHCNPDVISEVFGDFSDENSLSLSIYLSKLADFILK